MENNKIEFEFLDDIDLSEIEAVDRTGRWSRIFKEWINSNKKAVKLSLKSANERTLCRSSLYAFMRKYHLDWTVVSEKNTYNVYIVRA